MKYNGTQNMCLYYEPGSGGLQNMKVHSLGADPLKWVHGANAKFDFYFEPKGDLYTAKVHSLGVGPSMSPSA